MRKESTEILRTYKLFILLTVFLILGIMSPLTAKFMPDILSSAMNIDVSALGIGEPTAMDSFVQFFKNVGQIGLVVLVLLFSGLISTELQRGTLIPMLTKGLARHTVILAKFVTAALAWTLAYGLCLIVTLLYSAYYFDIGTLHHAVLAFGGVWAFGILLISLTMLGGVLFRSTYGSLLLVGGFIIITTILGVFSNLSRFNPATVNNSNVSLLQNSFSVQDFSLALCVCFALTIITLISTVLVFNKKQL